MQISGVEFTYEASLWIGRLMSDLGGMEVLLSGTEAAPDSGHVEAFRRFAENLEANLLQVRKQLSWGFPYHPIRIAPNNVNRVGIQFRHKITGKQAGMFFWD